MNRKWKIIIIAVIAGLIITGLGLSIINDQLKPEDKVSVYVFKKDLKSDTIIKKSDLTTVLFPVSLVNKRYVTDRETVIGKILVEKVKKGDYLMIDQFTDRGFTVEATDLSEYWKFSIETSELENFIGLQLERGETYQLVYRASKEIDNIRESGWISEVIVVDLIDSIGNKVFELRDENIQAIVLAIKSEIAMKEIIENKDDVEFELIKAPDNYTGPMVLDSDKTGNINESESANDN